VQLPKAVAVGLAPAGEVNTYPYDEEQQQRERPESAPPSCSKGYECDRHREFGQRQEDPEGGGQGSRYAKLNEALPRSGPIGELGQPRYEEN